MKHLWIISITCLMSLTLVGCFVSGDDTPARQRTTDNLRVYQPGDRLEYDVSGTNTSGNSALTGSIVITYASHTALPAPLQSVEVIPVIKESTAWSLYLGSIGYNDSVQRYISQDTEGNVSLYAYEGPVINTLKTYYWVNADGDMNTLPPAVSPVVITQSPLAVAKPSYAFHVLSGCDEATSCTTDLAGLLESQSITGTEDVTTNLGKFNAFHVEINHSPLTNYVPTESLPTNIDFRYFCNSMNSSLVSSATMSGTMWVFPEVGVVKYEIYCTNTISGETILMNASLSNTNIALPN